MVDTVPRARPVFWATCPAVRRLATGQRSEHGGFGGATRRPSGGGQRSVGSFEAPVCSSSPAASSWASQTGRAWVRERCVRQPWGGRRWEARIEGSERFAQPVDFAGELVTALLDLFTQLVDHVSAPPDGSGQGGDRTRVGLTPCPAKFRTGRRAVPIVISEDPGKSSDRDEDTLGGCLELGVVDERERLLAHLGYHDSLSRQRWRASDQSVWCPHRRFGSSTSTDRMARPVAHGRERRWSR